MLLTLMPALSLRALVADDADALHALVRANRGHLSQRGEHTDLIAASLDGLRTELGRADDKLRFGVFFDELLIGRVDLIGVEPGAYGLGYWLAEHATGKGYATAALSALLDHARQALGARDIYAGVSHGNERSAALLARLGFVPVMEFEGYRRFHRTLG